MGGWQTGCRGCLSVLHRSRRRCHGSDPMPLSVHLIVELSALSSPRPPPCSSSTLGLHTNGRRVETIPAHNKSPRNLKQKNKKQKKQPAPFVRCARTGAVSE